MVLVTAGHLVVNALICKSTLAFPPLDPGATPKHTSKFRSALVRNALSRTLVQFFGDFRKLSS
jgi:hypothetical protein